MADEQESITEPRRWKRFEQIVHVIQSTLAPNARVTLDDRIPGHKSGATRQIDVSIRTAVGASTILVIVQCKDYNHPVDVNDVGVLANVVEDVRAQKGVMVANANGFTQSAKNLAKAESIDLFTPVDAENKIWAEYFGNEPVKFNQKVSWKALFVERHCSFSCPIIVTGTPAGFVMPSDVEHSSLVHAGNGEPAGTVSDIFGTLWRNERLGDGEGSRLFAIEFATPLTFEIDLSRTRLRGLLFQVVESHVIRHGFVPIEKLKGLRDEQTGDLITRSLTTGVLKIEDLQAWPELQPTAEAPRVGVTVRVVEDWPIAEDCHLPKLSVREIRDQRQLDAFDILWR